MMAIPDFDIREAISGILSGAADRIRQRAGADAEGGFAKASRIASSLLRRKRAIAEWPSFIERINDAERRLEESKGYADKIAALQQRVAELEAETRESTLSDEQLTQLASAMAAIKVRRYAEARKRLELVLGDFVEDWRAWAE